MANLAEMDAFIHLFRSFSLTRVIGAVKDLGDGTMLSEILSLVYVLGLELPASASLHQH